MTLQETRELFDEMRVHCTRDFPADAYRQEKAVKSWHKYLLPYDKDDVMKALESYILTSNKGYMPTVSYLLSMIPGKPEAPTPGEMWGIVLQAMRETTYTPKEAFDSLPEIARKIIGSADSFRDMTSEKDKDRFLEQYEKEMHKGGYSWEETPIEHADTIRPREIKRSYKYFPMSVEVGNPKTLVIQFVQYENYPSGTITENRKTD